MNESTTRTAWLLGLAGLLPFAGCALASLAAPGWQELALVALRAYGAVILSFLGAVHWGLALHPAPGEEAAGPRRLVLGIVPALIGWVALLLPMGLALGVLATGVLVTAGSEQWGAVRGLVPRSYMLLRWVLSLGAAACLVAALLG